jgi:integrase
LKDRKHRKEAFRVPLSARAVEIAREMERIKVSDYVFPGQAPGKPFSNMALLTLLKRMNSVATEKWIDPADQRPITAHGFRATFRTWAEEATGFPHAVIEEAMGHKVGGQVERAYRRTDVLEKRRDLMTAWADYCAPDRPDCRPTLAGPSTAQDQVRRIPAIQESQSSTKSVPTKGTNR